MKKTEGTLSDAELLTRTIDFTGDLQEKVFKLESQLDAYKRALELACEKCRTEAKTNGRYTLCEECEVAKTLAGKGDAPSYPTTP